jgi:two-component system, NarL family, nitrate/nitrite response regulator NarL
MIRLFIVCDTRLYREGLAQILAGHAGITVVGAAADSEQALPGLRELSPDVVLLDSALSGATAALLTLREEDPDTKIVALTLPETEEDVIEFAEAGVSGYVTRDASVNDLVDTIRSVNRGELICSPRIAAALMRRLSAVAAENPRGTARLTLREREIVQLIDAGLANKEIASRLHIELSTVKNHVHNILEKLGVHRRAEIVRLLRTDPMSLR